MTKRESVIVHLDQLLKATLPPLSDDLRSQGWNESARQNIHRYLQEIREEIGQGMPPKRLAYIVRDFDYFGISRGAFLTDTARLQTELEKLYEP